MATSIFVKSTLEARLIYFGILITYPAYLVGGLYVSGSIIGWLVLILLATRLYIEGEVSFFRIPMLIWIWWLAMGLLLTALLVAHALFELGLGKTIKSSVGWAKGWALFAVFISLGVMVRLDHQRLVRCFCIVSFQSLLFSGLALILLLVGITGVSFVSPLSMIGGPGVEFFTVRLNDINPETGFIRLSYYCPWAPASGLMSCLSLVVCYQEKNHVWRLMGFLGAVSMCLLSQSRAGWVIFISLIPMLPLLHRDFKPELLVLFGVLICTMILLFEPIYLFLSDSYQQIKDTRPGSSRVRASLANIAIERWQSEAFTWGHGIVERGPKLVEFMPIGTHHTWYGLLFVKGIVGAAAFAFVMLFTLFNLLILFKRNREARVSLLLLLILFSYSFFENLEILIYLFWPVILYIGMTLMPRGKHDDLITKEI